MFHDVPSFPKYEWSHADVLLYQKVLQPFTPHNVVPPSYRLVYTHELVPYIYSIRSLVFLEIDLHLSFFDLGHSPSLPSLRPRSMVPSDSIPTWICAFHCCAAFSVCSACCSSLFATSTAASQQAKTWSSLWRWHLRTHISVTWELGMSAPFQWVYLIFIYIYINVITVGNYLYL